MLKASPLVLLVYVQEIVLYHTLLCKAKLSSTSGYLKIPSPFVLDHEIVLYHTLLRVENISSNLC